MFFGRSRSRRLDPSAQFQSDLLACARALGRKLPPVARRYSLQAFIIALAMHLREALRLGMKEGHLTEEQARELVTSLLPTDPDSTAQDAASTRE